MNSEKRRVLNAGWIIVAAIFATSFFACKKTGPTIAVISVVDSTGRAISGAAVTLWQDTAVNNANGVQSSVRITKTSDAAGKAEFEFTLEAYLNVQAIHNADTGRAVVRLKEHETVAQTVHL
jgi:hypothetical protein